MTDIISDFEGVMAILQYQYLFETEIISIQFKEEILTNHLVLDI